MEGQPLEWGPDSFLAAKPWARRLAEELGLSPDLVAPGPAAAKTYLWLRGRLRPLPLGLAMGIPTRPGSLLRAVTAGVVGPLAALRAAVEPLLPALPDDDMSVAEVARRRLGRQVASRLVAPLVGGVFGVPAEELSMAAALPQLAGARSLVLAMTGRPRASGPVFLSLRGGMGRLVDRPLRSAFRLSIRLTARLGRSGTPSRRRTHLCSTYARRRLQAERGASPVRLALAGAGGGGRGPRGGEGSKPVTASHAR